VATHKKSEQSTLSAREVRLISRVLADPHRFQLLKRIAAEPCTACADLRTVFPISAPTLSHHLKELASAGLIALLWRVLNPAIFEFAQYFQRPLFGDTIRAVVRLKIDVGKTDRRFGTEQCGMVTVKLPTWLQKWPLVPRAVHMMRAKPDEVSPQARLFRRCGRLTSRLGMLIG